MTVTNLTSGIYTACLTDADNCTLCKIDTVFNDPLYVREFSSADLKVYPNPSNGHFTVTAPYFMENDAFIRILDMNGKLIDSRNISQKTEQEVDLSKFNEGIYVIESGTKSGKTGVFRTRIILFK
ncbi:MAG: T9SS type A sorting domain-containing protein [Bacteroidetes bacterium]|nr:T9SS type A sorting domain-containing protein [Bacteroidota bacterium]